MSTSQAPLVIVFGTRESLVNIPFRFPDDDFVACISFPKTLLQVLARIPGKCPLEAIHLRLANAMRAKDPRYPNVEGLRSSRLVSTADRVRASR